MFFAIPVIITSTFQNLLKCKMLLSFYCFVTFVVISFSNPNFQGISEVEYTNIYKAVVYTNNE